MVFLMKRASPLRHEGRIRRGRLFAIESYYSHLRQGRQFAKDSNCAIKGGRAKGSIFAKEGNVTVEGNFSKGGLLCQGGQFHQESEEGNFAMEGNFAE
jgi:hypothetical protein